MRLAPMLMIAGMCCAVMSAGTTSAAGVTFNFNLQVGTPDPQVIYVPDTSPVVVNTVVVRNGRRVIYVREHDRPLYIQALRVKHEKERGNGNAWGRRGRGGEGDRGRGHGHGHGHGHGD